MEKIINFIKERGAVIFFSFIAALQVFAVVASILSMFCRVGAFVGVTGTIAAVIAFAIFANEVVADIKESRKG